MSERLEYGPHAPFYYDYCYFRNYANMKLDDRKNVIPGTSYTWNDAYLEIHDRSDKGKEMIRRIMDLAVDQFVPHL